MVVDDEVDIRNYLYLSLKADYHVLIAEDGAQAWELIQQNDIDVVVSDLMMPHVDGMQLCSLIKNEITTCHIPIILLTAKTGLTSQIEGLETGADGYIAKPFNWEYLVATIAAAIKRNERLQIKYTQYLYPAEPVESNPTPAAPRSVVNDEFIDSAIRIVEQEMEDSEFNGEVLAARLIMSRVHLHRKLRSILDVSTSEFIRNIRLRKAALLLMEGRMNISEVCYNTGFSSPAYFSSCFTKFYGVSPKEYALRLTSDTPPIVG